MSEQLSGCPVCRGGEFSPYLSCRDYTVSQEYFSLQICRHCQLVFTNPRPAMHEIGVYYQSEEYISHTNSSKGLMNKVYQWARKRAIRKKLALINGFAHKDRTLLDYGCGTGEFLAAAKADGWQTRGIEPDDQARGLAIGNHHLEVSAPDTLNTLKDNSLSVITLWHVLEHVHALRETVAHFHRALKADGTLIIAVPNHTAYDAQLFKEHWAAYDVPRHLYHFSVDSMQRLMKEEGFEIERIESLFFDPFYITLLSDKYKTGSSSYLHAIWVGLLTTLKGRSDIRANSSLLYIIRKKR